MKIQNHNMNYLLEYSNIQHVDLFNLKRQYLNLYAPKFYNYGGLIIWRGIQVDKIEQLEQTNWQALKKLWEYDSWIEMFSYNELNLEDYILENFSKEKFLAMGLEIIKSLKESLLITFPGKRFYIRFECTKEVSHIGITFHTIRVDEPIGSYDLIDKNRCIMVEIIS